MTVAPVPSGKPQRRRDGASGRPPWSMGGGLAHTRRGKEWRHMAVRKNQKRRSAMKRLPVQKRSKSLSSLKRMRSHDPRTAADFQQADRVAPRAAPISADPSPEWSKGVGRQSARRRLSVAVLLPGLAFVSMGRSVPGLICYALQASVVGWLPAALWATYATRHCERKHRQLASRLRPN